MPSLRIMIEKINILLQKFSDIQSLDLTTIDNLAFTIKLRSVISADEDASKKITSYHIKTNLTSWIR